MCGFKNRWGLANARKHLKDFDYELIERYVEVAPEEVYQGPEATRQLQAHHHRRSLIRRCVFKELQAQRRPSEQRCGILEETRHRRLLYQA